MIPQILQLFVLLTIPASMLGGEPGRSSYVFKPVIPDTIKGIQIQFEVKQTKVVYQGRAVNIYCLCADITNQNDQPERIRIRYQCQGKAKSKEVEIKGNQQRIILVDKCMMTEESPTDIKEYYDLVLLEYGK
jgi:hypothetical protein